MFSPKTREKLRYYVYLYLDPRNDRPFYVGKGKGNRCFMHLKHQVRTAKTRVIQELGKLGLKPRIEILKYGLTENQALLVESTAIDLIGVEHLTNLVHGHGSADGSRAEVKDLAATLEAEHVRISDPVILIMISRQFRFGMSIRELYDATRCAWKVAPQRHKPRFALSVYHGIVRAVFEIETWVPAGTTMRFTDSERRTAKDKKRWEFVGQVAEDHVCRRYMGKSVARYFKQGAQNPIKYVKC